MSTRTLQRIGSVSLVLFVVLVPSLTADAAPPSPSGQMRWRVYQDRRDGFTIRYPSTWSLQPAAALAGPNITTITLQPANGSITAQVAADWARVEIGVFAHGKPTQQSLAEWARPAPWMRAFQIGENTLPLANGLKAVQQTYQLEGAIVCTTFVVRGNKVYFITITSPNTSLSAEMVTLVRSFNPGGITYRARATLVDHLYSQDDTRDGGLVAPLSPVAWRTPVDGCYSLTAGPGEGYHRNAAAEAMDLGMNQGTPIRAVAAGKVTFADWSSIGYGWAVEVQHASGMFSWYAHLSKIVVSGGDVSPGQEIGLSGNTGNSTGPHLHFHARVGSNPVCLRDLPGVRWNPSFPPGNPNIDSGCACYPLAATVPEQCLPGSRPLSCTHISDAVPPEGAIVAPVENATLITGTLRLEGWARDGQSGLDRAHFIVLLQDRWQQIGPDFTSSPFTFDWDLCAAEIPDGPLTIGLDIWDVNGNVAYTPGGAHKITKSYICPPPCAPASGQVAIYAHASYSGTCAVHGPGLYADAAAMGLPNDSLSSLKVGSNARAILCGDIDLGGDCYTYTTDIPYVGDTLNDRFSSLKVEMLADKTSPTGNIVIADGAAVVRGFEVTLTLSASDDNGVPEMRLHDEATSFGPWEPFVPSKRWTFTPREGEHTLAVQFRDAAGNLSEVYTATIVCQTSEGVFLPLIEKELPTTQANASPLIPFLFRACTLAVSRCTMVPL